METKEILQFCLEKGLLIDNDLLSLFKDNVDTETTKIIIEKISQVTQQKIITKSIFANNKDKLNKIFLTVPTSDQTKIEKLKIKLGLSIEIEKNIEIKSSPAIITNINQDNVKVFSHPVTSKKLEVKDFVKYFKNRFVSMRNILQEHSELNNLVSINKISGNKQNISLIGMVRNKKITKNKNMLLEIEDLTGKIVALINANKKELFEKADQISLDSTIGFKCSGNKEIVFVNDVVFPESRITERKRSNFEEYALFIGDLHVGSKLFLEDNFMKFIEYLNGNVPNTPEVDKIKYLFIVGDLISGVGIYQGQEKELTIPDVEGQYEKTAELLSKIKKDIKIIISPGNHDALRIMEPQPLLDEKYAWPLYNMKNVILTTNPSTINIGTNPDFSGLNVLVYHGYSYHYYAGNIPHLVKDKATHTPEKIMAYLLKNRHLAPTHSSTLYFPSEKDSHLIQQVPDIFVSGHTHKSGISYYNNILTISCSAWESKTAFQEKMGNEPDFCKVPMLNTKTGAVKILDFE